MRKYLGVWLVGLMVVSGCGGDNDPPSLEGPATLTSVNDCLEESGLFPELEAEKDPIFDPAEYNLGGKKSRLTSNVSGFYDDTLMQIVVRIYDTAEEAATMNAIGASDAKQFGKIEEISDTPEIELRYDREMPDDGVAALKLCTHEDY